MMALGTGYGTALNTIIKSIQTGVIAIGSGATSNTAAINAVNPDYAMTIFEGYRNSNSTAQNNSTDMPRVELTSGSVVTAYRNTATTTVVTVGFTIIEFYPWALQQPVQRGTILVNNGQQSTLQGITPVGNTARSLTSYLGQTSTNTANAYGEWARVQFINNTTIGSLSGAAVGGDVTVGWEVIEFNDAVVASCEQNFIQIGGAGTTTTKSLNTAVDMSATTIFHNGFNIAATSDQRHRCYVELISTTQVRATRPTGSGTTITMYITVVNFRARWIKSLQRGVTTIATSQTQNNATISAVVQAKTFVNNCGQSSDLFASNPNSSFATSLLTSTTNIRIERAGSSASTTLPYSWEAVEFL